MRKKAKRKLVCPKRWKGRKVSRMRNGNCYVKLANGRRRFVKKVGKRKTKR